MKRTFYIILFTTVLFLSAVSFAEQYQLLPKRFLR